MVNSLPRTAAEYLQCFNHLVAITDAALTVVETQPEQFVSDADRQASVSRIAAAVDTVAALRGDSGVFMAGRPADISSDQQHEMYAAEDMLRERLARLSM